MNYDGTMPVVPPGQHGDVLAYYGPRSKATGVVSKDAAGQYWCDGQRFSRIQFALDYAEAHHD